MQVIKSLRFGIFAGCSALLLLPLTATAQDAPAATAPTNTATTAGTSTEPSISVELNKLDPQNNGCRAYLVVNNKSQTHFKKMNLDLVLFRPDGIIGRRFAVDLAPIRPKKRAVKIFDLDGVACDQVGSFLINDILECSEEGGGTRDNCLAQLSVSSLAKAQISK